ncbi:MAG: XdhC family protein [Puia sp.]|nr:XdhC family protein [Puia sp.]
MKEMHELIRAFDEAVKAGRKTALATVVHVDGSSYRRPGARMLVDDTGRLTGAISGGCLEGDALRKALWVLSQQKSRLVTYDTMDDDDARFGVGLGCNGIIQVLIEPINPADPANPIELLKAFADTRQKVVLVTLFSLQDTRGEQPGTCLLWKEDASLLTKGSLAGDPGIREILLEDVRLAFAGQSSHFKNYVSAHRNLTAFIEYIPPPVSLVIIGAGNDVVPLVGMAQMLGWQTTVIDGRATHAKTERFAPGCQVRVSKPEKALEGLVIDEQTVFVLMTHNYNYDLAMLRALLGRRLAYIGSLGPKKKLDRMLGELKEQGLVVTGFERSALYGPSGLDIGAETPEEIALSILAEIKAVLAGRTGQPLRNNTETIHARAATAIQKISLGQEENPEQ